MSSAGRAAYKVALSFLRTRRLTYTGGCKVFYSPAEWMARGESYGHNAALIVVYDGANAKEACRMDGRMYEPFKAALDKAGFYVEECTGTYSAIYEIDRAPIAVKSHTCRECGASLPGA